ncbi:helix-turn-helix domain-containing protein [Maribacter sp. Hel_I_7]|uniref:helix-turn-helix domain-containing protein n=1 Tax=Maribacter sp. Hel_I_7 TaxID=1249997 RepID=UPI00068E27BA|nr:helix-turn-helix domain-containing protein [Maribacter sp. Hel_I_7]
METPTLEQTPRMVLELNKKLDLFLEKFSFTNLSKDEIEQPIEIDEACSYLKESKDSLYKKARKGLIPCHKKNGRLYFFKSELLEWIKSGNSNSEKHIQQETDNLLSRKSIRTA